MVKLNSGDDGALTGQSVSLVFKDVGDVSFQGVQTGSELAVGKAVHATSRMIVRAYRDTCLWCLPVKKMK